MTASCPTCRYWKRLFTMETGGMVRSGGQCRRHAPVRQGEWPEVSDIDWCGDWHENTVVTDAAERTVTVTNHGGEPPLRDVPMR